MVVDDAFHYFAEHPHEDARHVTSPDPLSTQAHTHIGRRRSFDPEICPRPVVLVLSAADRKGPIRQAEDLERYLQDPSMCDGHPQTVRDLAFTLSERRTKLPWRSFLMWNIKGGSYDNFAQGFSSPVQCSSTPKLTLLFTGQGAKQLKVSQDMFEIFEFQQSLRHCQSHLDHVGSRCCLKTELLEHTNQEGLKTPTLSQTISTCLQIAQIDVLASWGMAPDATVGHSSGEIAAAYASGLINREDAVRIAYFRGLLSESISNVERPSGMLAVGAPILECENILRALRLLDSLEVGCINSPNSTTLTGASASISIMKSELDSRGIINAVLPTGLAYHSGIMKAVAPEYECKIGCLTPVTSAPFRKIVPMVSSVTGLPQDARIVSRASYWSANLVSRVQFQQALEGALNAIQTTEKSSNILLVEIGPYGLLKQAVKDILESSPRSFQWQYESLFQRRGSSHKSLLDLAGSCFCYGVYLDMMQVNRIDKAKSQVVCNLPGYPFSTSTQHWHESHLSRKFRLRSRGRHELLGLRPTDWNAEQPRWRNVLSAREMPWMLDHKVRRM